jgi:hypothetical protein
MCLRAAANRGDIQSERLTLMAMVGLILMVINNNIVLSLPTTNWGRQGRDRMVVGFATTYAISAHHH